MVMKALLKYSWNKFLKLTNMTHFPSACQGQKKVLMLDQLQYIFITEAAVRTIKLFEH